MAEGLDALVGVVPVSGVTLGPWAQRVDEVGRRAGDRLGDLRLEGPIEHGQALSGRSLGFDARPHRRRPLELEAFIDLVERTPVRLAVVIGGDYDPA